MFVRKILVILTYKTFFSIDFFVVLRCQISKSTTWKSQKMFLKIQNTFVHFYEYIILNEILPFPPRHDQSEKSSWLPKSTRLGMVLKKMTDFSIPQSWLTDSLLFDFNQSTK